VCARAGWLRPSVISEDVANSFCHRNLLLAGIGISVEG